MVVWYLSARHQRERYDSGTNQKSASHSIRLFNFVNENTGRSLKLRWLRDWLGLPFVGLGYGVRNVLPV